ncbi:hypothetical protein F511_30212 [Dorcoceras hygrometricum]|uniref:Uncharacterized protein n=1 Tax=Dorcoceras hygrometricum TaxID=472368 RepID=A0A2Z7A103_9LAMI|nr:hypothetical protein F511_30212 [Dorcoceras hygrometricum]
MISLMFRITNKTVCHVELSFVNHKGRIHATYTDKGKSPNNKTQEHETMLLKSRGNVTTITSRLSPLFEPIFLPLIKQISFSTPQVDYLRASIPILFKLGALLAIVGIRNSHPTTDDTPALERSIVAFITYTNKCARAHVGIANHTFSIIFLTKPSYSYPWLLATHD